MAARLIDIELEQDTDSGIQFEWIDESTDLPVDLTGYSADMQIKLNPSDTVAILEYKSLDGTIILGGASGIITILIASVDTIDATWQSAYYDLYLTRSDGVTKERFSKGRVTLELNVTR